MERAQSKSFIRKTNLWAMSQVPREKGKSSFLARTFSKFYVCFICLSFIIYNLMGTLLSLGYLLRTITMLAKYHLKF